MPCLVLCAVSASTESSSQEWEEHLDCQQCDDQAQGGRGGGAGPRGGAASAAQMRAGPGVKRTPAKGPETGSGGGKTGPEGLPWRMGLCQALVVWRAQRMLRGSLLKLQELTLAAKSRARVAAHW